MLVSLNRESDQHGLFIEFFTLGCSSGIYHERTWITNRSLSIPLTNRGRNLLLEESPNYYRPQLLTSDF